MRGVMLPRAEPGHAGHTPCPCTVDPLLGGCGKAACWAWLPEWACPGPTSIACPHSRPPCPASCAAAPQTPCTPCAQTRLHQRAAGHGAHKAQVLRQWRIRHWHHRHHAGVLARQAHRGLNSPPAVGVADVGAVVAVVDGLLGGVDHQHVVDAGRMHALGGSQGLVHVGYPARQGGTGHPRISRQQ